VIDVLYVCACRACRFRVREREEEGEKERRGREEEDEEGREGGREGERGYCNVYVAGVPIMCVSSYACGWSVGFLSFCPPGLGVGMGGVGIGLCGGTTAPCTLPSSLPSKQGLVSQEGRRVRRMGGAVARLAVEKEGKKTYQTNLMEGEGEVVASNRFLHFFFLPW